MAESSTITREALEKAKFRGPMQFSDGHKGMARQDYECVSEPRFGYAWRQEEYGDQGRTFYTVDGREVADLDEAMRILAEPADPESPREQMQRTFRDPEARRAYLLAAKASHHASGGPFGPVVAAMERSGHSWHVGINRFQDTERAAGREWQSWLYDAKNAAHEAGRLMILWRRDRERDTGLRCVLGQGCRSCPMLNTIETAMVESRTPREGAILPGYDVWDTDIDMAKTWTCITHVLRTPSVTYTGEGLLHTAADREHAEAESRHLANMAALATGGARG